MRAVRACIVGTIGIAAIALLCACLGAAESQPAAEKTPDLQQRVAALEEKVAQLEKKLDQLSTSYLPTVPPGGAIPYVAPRAPIAPQAQPGAPLVAPPQARPGIPPNAVPHEFNGQTFYIVPLAK